MGFMTLSISISISLVGGGRGGGLITQGSHWCTHSSVHTQSDTHRSGGVSALWFRARLNTHAHKKHGHTPSDAYTQSTFTVSQHPGNLPTFTRSFLARLQWDAGEKCTGETETSCSACWHSQRVKGRQSGSLDCIDPCELGGPSRVRGEQFDWQLLCTSL